MKKACVLLLLAFSIVCKSQSYFDQEDPGFRLSPHFSYLFPGQTRLNELVKDKTTYTGLGFGIDGLVQLSPKWRLQTGILFTNIEETYNSGKLKWGSDSQGDPIDTLPDRMQLISDFYFLGIPVGLRFSPNPYSKLRFVFHPALQFGYVLSHRNTQTTLYRNGKIEQRTGLPSPGEFGTFHLNAHVGVAAEWRFHPVAAFLIEPHFSHQITTFEKNQGTRLYGAGIRGGFIFKL
jgi:hypothetical protein